MSTHLTGRPLAGQQHRHIARRHVEHLGGLLAGQPGPLHGLTQSLTQFPAANRRLAMWHGDTSRPKIIESTRVKFD
jgi:hypothetical protein